MKKKFLPLPHIEGHLHNRLFVDILEGIAVGGVGMMPHLAVEDRVLHLAGEDRVLHPAVEDRVLLLAGEDKEVSLAVVQDTKGGIKK